MIIEPGSRVRITSVVSSVEERLGRSLVHVEATYEGDFPFSVLAYTNKRTFSLDYSEENVSDLKSLGYHDFEELRAPFAKDYYDCFGTSLSWSDIVLTSWSALHDALEEKYPKNYIIENNPRLLLDDGQHIWGAECWWMPIEN